MSYKQSWRLFHAALSLRHTLGSAPEMPCRPHSSQHLVGLGWERCWPRGQGYKHTNMKYLIT